MDQHSMRKSVIDKYWHDNKVHNFETELHQIYQTTKP
jgi:hypothetical protein